MIPAELYSRADTGVDRVGTPETAVLPKYQWSRMANPPAATKLQANASRSGPGTIPIPT